MIEDVLKELDSINAKINNLPIDRDTKTEVQGYLHRINSILLKTIFP